MCDGHFQINPTTPWPSPFLCRQIWHRRSSHRAFGGCSSEDYDEDLNWTHRLDYNWNLGRAKEVASKVCRHMT